MNGKPHVQASNKKFNAASPGLRQIVLKDARNNFAANPDDDSVSMEPSDSGGWDDSGESFKTIGGPSNQAVTLANLVAREVAAPLGKYVGMYAYAAHQFPPDIAVEPNVIVSFATRFLKPGRDLSASIEGWRKQGVKLVGIRDYSSVWAWDMSMPGQALGGNIDYLQQAIPAYHDLGARFYTSEFQNSWGAYGLGFYLTSRLLWNPNEDVDDDINDFLKTSFGPAAGPMANFYSLLNGKDSVLARFTSPAEFYSPLLEAMEAAKGRPDVQRRIIELMTYIRYVELVSDLEKARQEDKTEALQAAYVWALRSEPMQILPVSTILHPKYGMLQIYKRYGSFSAETLATIQRNAAASPVTAEEVVALAQAALAKKSPGSPAEAPLLSQTEQSATSPWMRYGASFGFPLRKNELVKADLSMRRFGFSRFPRYVILDPDKKIIARGTLPDDGSPINISGAEAGTYDLVVEYTPNLVRCQSEKSFYLNPSTEGADLTMVAFEGSLYFRLPKGMTAQVSVGARDDKEKVNTEIRSGDGQVVSKNVDASGLDPEVTNLPASQETQLFQVKFGKPSSGAYQDLYFRFNGAYSCPVALSREELEASLQTRQ